MKKLLFVLLLAGLGTGVYWGVGKAQDYFGLSDYSSNPATNAWMVPLSIMDGRYFRFGMQLNF